MRNLIDEYKKQDAATVHEAMGRDGAMMSQIKPVAAGSKVCGYAFTVKTAPHDNLALHRALYNANQNDVLVVATGYDKEGAYWGDIMTFQAMASKLGGIVLDGAIRDSALIRKSSFPVFSAGICMKGMTKDHEGELNIPITCGGTVVYPGDIILGDDDGVVVIPAAEAEAVLERANQRALKEREIIGRIRNGENMYDIMGFAKQSRPDRKG